MNRRQAAAEFFILRCRLDPPTQCKLQRWRHASCSPHSDESAEEPQIAVIPFPAIEDVTLQFLISYGTQKAEGFWTAIRAKHKGIP